MDLYKAMGIPPLISCIKVYSVLFSLFEILRYEELLQIAATLVAIFTWILIFTASIAILFGANYGKFFLLIGIPFSVLILMLPYVPFLFSFLPQNNPILAIALAFLLNSMYVFCLFWSHRKNIVIGKKM